MPVNFEVPLANAEYNDLLKRRDAIFNACNDHGDVYFFSDTETTGTEIIDARSGRFNRVLEWSGVFAYKDSNGLYQPILDSDGLLVYIDEPINPFIEKHVNKKQKFSIEKIPADSIDIHGITLDYLFAESEGVKSRPKLTKKAAPFPSVYYAVLTLIDVKKISEGDANIFIAFHNAPFDVKFLSNECEMNNLPLFENHFSVLDSFAMAKSVFSANDLAKFTLDEIFKYGLRNYPNFIKNTDRPVHTALIDSLILMEVFNTIACYKKEKSLVSIF